jgi:hypothetical protein
MHLYHILINWSQKFWVVYVQYSFIYEQCAGFSSEDPKWYKLVTSALGDIFINYNLQFCHLLCEEQLKFSWEKVR